MEMFRQRTYVIERCPAADGTSVYAAFVPDPVGFAAFAQRLLLSDFTVTELKEKMARHYPGATCAYEPEDATAAVAAAMDLLKGGA